MTPPPKRTAYDVLGVDSGASQTKIKQAYVRLAQINHPDRQAESSPAARHQAEATMREINAAWDSVSNPTRRAAYDKSLRPAGPAWETATTSGGTRAPRTATVRPGGGPPPPPSSGLMVEESHALFWRWGPGVILAIVIVGLFVFTAVANQSQNVNATTSSTSGVRSWEVGDCIVIATTGGRRTPILTDCGREGADQVRQITDLGRPCGAGLYAYDISAEEVRLCLAA